MEARINDLSALLPDIRDKLGRMKADVLCGLIRDPEVSLKSMSAGPEICGKIFASIPCETRDVPTEQLQFAFNWKADRELLQGFPSLSFWHLKHDN